MQCDATGQTTTAPQDCATQAARAFLRATPGRGRASYGETPDARDSYLARRRALYLRVPLPSPRRAQRRRRRRRRRAPGPAGGRHATPYWDHPHGRACG